MKGLKNNMTTQGLTQLLSENEQDLVAKDNKILALESEVSSLKNALSRAWWQATIDNKNTPIPKTAKEIALTLLGLIGT